MRNATIAIAATTLALAALQAHAVTKCVDRNGRISYQDGVCPEGTKQEKVTVMPGPEPSPAQADSQKPKAAKPPGMIPSKQDVPDPRMDALVGKLATFEGCEGASPGWSRDGAPVYQAWRASNTELLERLPRSRHYMKILNVERQRVQWQLAGADSRKSFLASCQALAQPSNKPTR